MADGLTTDDVDVTMMRQIISYHIVDLKRLKVGTDTPKLKVKMQSVSEDDVSKRLIEKPHFKRQIIAVL